MLCFGVFRKSCLVAVLSRSDVILPLGCETFHGEHPACMKFTALKIIGEGGGDVEGGRHAPSSVPSLLLCQGPKHSISLKWDFCIQKCAIYYM